MNRTDVNKVEVNRVRVNMCTVNSFAARKAKGGTAMPVPIAKYMCYGKTNDDEDRDILQDLSGNGHDIQLYNFAFAGSSGYGLYSENFLDNYYNNSSRGKADVFSSKIVISSSFVNYTSPIVQSNTIETVPSYKVKITGIKDETVCYRYITIDNKIGNYTILEDGIYDVPISYQNEANRYSGWGVSITDSCNIIIEQISEHKGALCSDGIDDKGSCENFPILTKERGYTICAIRKNFKKFDSNYQCLLSNRNTNNNTGAFNVEVGVPTSNQVRTDSFGYIYNVFDINYYPKLFTYQTSNKYNGALIKKGENTGTNVLNLFKLNYSDSSYLFMGALYALEIYDRDLTDEEIALVKARMIREYEEGTGNKYEEETV